MPRSVLPRLEDIGGAITNARIAMSGTSPDDLARDQIKRAAFERFMEIVSEASRHVPGELKARHPQRPWIEIAHFGNLLRHAYQRVDPSVLWQTYAEDLDPLDAAVIDLIDHLESGP